MLKVEWNENKVIVDVKGVRGVDELKAFGYHYWRLQLMNEKKSEQTRNSNFEMCRILVMMMIVGCHFATHGGFAFDKSVISIPRLWWNLLELGGNFGVDVFVILSGYFLIDDKSILSKRVNKIVRLWLQISFYSLLLYAVSILVGKEEFDFIELGKILFPINSAQWWFATTYFVLFLLYPYINRLLKSFTQDEYKRYLILIIVLWSVIPTFLPSKIGSNALIEFVMYYSIAGYIRLFGLKWHLTSGKWFGLWFAFSLLKFTSSVGLMVLGKWVSIAADHTLWFYGRASILTILSAVCFFMGFATKKIRTNSLINELASSAFGVYLLHDSNFLRPVLWNDLFKNASYQNTLRIIPYSLVVVIIVYAACTVVDQLRRHILEKPIMRYINILMSRMRRL